MKKKILLITGGFNPELAGGAKQAETIINALKNDFDFTILSFSKKFNNNISVYKKIFRIKIYYNLFFVKTIFKTIIYFIKYKKKFEIIHLRGSTKKIFC